MASPKLTHEQRRLAAIDMINYYFNANYVDWRYIKLLSIKKQLSSKYAYYEDIVSEIENEENVESCIAQPITNGLYFEAIAECVQYIEDLFALIKASANTEYFVKNIITYEAGQIRSFIKTFPTSDKDLGKWFHFKYDLQFEEGTDSTPFTKGIESLRQLIIELKTFFVDYEFFYIQYKHGLTLPMRPFGNSYTAEQVQKEKDGEMKPYVTAFDNFNLAAAAKKGNFTSQQPVMMPAFTENVRFHISALSEENNYLRLVYPKDQKLDFDRFVNIAKRVRYCTNLFINNYYNELHPGERSGKFQLPDDPDKNSVSNCTYFEE